MWCRMPLEEAVAVVTAMIAQHFDPMVERPYLVDRSIDHARHAALGQKALDMKY